MQPTTEILARISRNSLANKDEIFTRLYRYMLRSDLYFLAYKNLYANNGAATKGANDDTADGFSEAKIANIIQRLADETYQPTPARRTYIQKKNNPKKKRPLGIPTFTDKLVQEVLRMVLEAVYEPVFLPVSHGFRPKRSCHTALKSLKMEFNGMRWFVEGDIKGCFDNIDHSVLVGLIHSKIKDARLIKLIYKFLKAGYLEDWKYHKTYSGTPQGGIISPLLANIYLHELDKFVMKLKSEFDTHGQEPVRTEYRLLSNDLQKLSYHIGRRTGAEREQLLSEYNEKRKLMLKMPCTAQTKKCIKYIRYADDFILGVKGSQEDCQWIKSKLSEFIRETLKMELSEEKTLITHSSERARFLGYDVRVRRSSIIKHGGPGKKTKRTLNNSCELSIPFDDKIHSFIFAKEIAIQKPDGKLMPVRRKSLLRLTGQDFWGTMFVFAEAALSSMVGRAKRQNAPSTIPVNCLSHSMIRFTASFSPRKLRYRNRMGNSCLSAVNLFCDSQIWKSFLPTMRNYGESATTMELPAIFINCATFPISWNTVASKPSQVSINAP